MNFTVKSFTTVGSVLAEPLQLSTSGAMDVVPHQRGADIQLHLYSVLLVIFFCLY